MKGFLSAAAAVVAAAESITEIKKTKALFSMFFLLLENQWTDADLLEPLSENKIVVPA
jgi:hypothetical protein